MSFFKGERMSSFWDNLNVSARIKRKINDAIEKRVETRVKARLAENRLSLKDFTPEELAIIYEDEKIKLMDDLKSKGVIAILAALGISFF